MVLRTWIRFALVALIILLGIRAYVLSPGADMPAPETPARAQVPTPGETAASVLTKTLRNAGQRSHNGLSWRVTQANSAHEVMVIDVEAQQPSDAHAIAEAIVAPLRGTYQEVLIYIRGTGGAGNGLVERIQWTPDGGYVDTSYTER